MAIRLMAQPCRNFNILGATTLIDPVDGRQKVVLSNFAAGSTGNLIFVDPVTGSGESLQLPGDDGAWALLNLHNRTLLVGTCPRQGYLHRLDLATRTWSDPLRDDDELYIWNLTLGADGMVYGGTYPGCVLLRYDPQNHQLQNLGRASDNPDNLYSRYVYGEASGHIFITCGMAEMHVARYDLKSGEMSRFGRPGAELKAVTAEYICTETAGNLDFYDAHTLLPIENSPPVLPAEPAATYSGSRLVLPLLNGDQFAVRGQEYYIMAGAGQPTLREIPSERPPTRIITLAADPQGKIWGASGFGQTIFCYDPVLDESWNSQVVCDKGGEVYGMAFAQGRLFLSAYSGGDHIVYDPEQPWDQVGNHNPRTLESVYPDLIRPEAKSVIGPDGHFWTGWMAQYGVYGGGLSRVNTTSGQVTLWPDPVPGQPLVGLAADDGYLYFITGGSGNGLSPKSEPFHFVVWDPAGHIVWQQSFPAGRRLHQVAAVSGRVALCIDQELHLFDPASLAWSAVMVLPAACHYLLARQNGSLLAFCKDGLFSVDIEAESITRQADLPGIVTTGTETPAGEIFFAHNMTLFRSDPSSLDPSI